MVYNSALFSPDRPSGKPGSSAGQRVQKPTPMHRARAPIPQSAAESRLAGRQPPGTSRCVPALLGFLQGQRKPVRHDNDPSTCGRFRDFEIGTQTPHTCACASQGGRKPEVRRSVRRTGPRRARSLELTRSVLQEHGFSRSASSSAGFNSRLQSVAFQVRLAPEEAALDLGAPAIRGQRPTLSVKRIFRPIPAQ